MITGHEAWIDARRPRRHARFRPGAHPVDLGPAHGHRRRLRLLPRSAAASRPGRGWRCGCRARRSRRSSGWSRSGAIWCVSGAPPPAERAAITASIAFVAILLDRQAITMHALAVAALVVLMLQPEAIVTPGFQMSFAATAALVALVEAWPPPDAGDLRALADPGVPDGAATGWSSAVTASLVAGLATGPFAMQHFNRTAMYGLLGQPGDVADRGLPDDAGAGARGLCWSRSAWAAPFLWRGGQGRRPDAGRSATGRRRCRAR